MKFYDCKILREYIQKLEQTYVLFHQPPQELITNASCV